MNNVGLCSKNTFWDVIINSKRSFTSKRNLSLKFCRSAKFNLPSLKFLAAAAALITPEFEASHWKCGSPQLSMTRDEDCTPNSLLTRTGARALSFALL